MARLVLAVFLAVRGVSAKRQSVRLQAVCGCEKMRGMCSCCAFMGCFLEGLGGFAAGGFKDSLARPVFHGEWVSRVGGVVLLYCGADGGVFCAC